MDNFRDIHKISSFIKYLKRMIMIPKGTGSSSGTLEVGLADGFLRWCWAQPGVFCRQVWHEGQ
jgi:hypothetical protein